MPNYDTDTPANPSLPTMDQAIADVRHANRRLRLAEQVSTVARQNIEAADSDASLARRVLYQVVEAEVASP